MATFLFLTIATLLAPTNGLLVAPLVAPSPLTRCATPLATAVGAPSTPRIRQVLRLPLTAAQGVWNRCTPDECNLGRPRPLAFLKSLIPKRRPLSLIAHNECSVGVYKVERRNGKRVIKMFPLQVQEQCTAEEAFDMF